MNYVDYGYKLIIEVLSLILKMGYVLLLQISNHLVINSLTIVNK